MPGDPKRFGGLSILNEGKSLTHREQAHEPERTTYENLAQKSGRRAPTCEQDHPPEPWEGRVFCKGPDAPQSHRSRATILLHSLVFVCLLSVLSAARIAASPMRRPPKTHEALAYPAPENARCPVAPGYVQIQNARYVLNFYSQLYLRTLCVFSLPPPFPRVVPREGPDCRFPGGLDGPSYRKIHWKRWGASRPTFPYIYIYRERES